MIRACTNDKIHKGSCAVASPVNTKCVGSSAWRAKCAPRIGSANRGGASAFRSLTQNMRVRASNHRTIILLLQGHVTRVSTPRSKRLTNKRTEIGTSSM